MEQFAPQDQAFWYLNRPSQSPCRNDMSVDVAVIGGGIAGLSAAQAFVNRGKKVVLLEQYYCGAGASGKNSGFVTPNAELSFTDFKNIFNDQAAQTIWNTIVGGVELIRNTIESHQLSVEYKPESTLILASSPKGFALLSKEYENLVRHSYPVSLYTAQEAQEIIKAQKQHGAMVYDNTFSFNGYAYCQELKRLLESQGVMIFEETPVTAIDGHLVKTAHATITAEYIIVCTDRFAPEIGVLKDDVYHAQTFVMMSQELTDDQIKSVFPAKQFMCWDTELIYNYFRITPQKRLVLGGGSLINTYSTHPVYNSRYMFNKLTRYLERQFPELDTTFIQMWPGLIGISKDIMPLAGKDKDHPHIFYIAAAAGLPIAAALGSYSAEHLLEGNNALDEFFSPYRSFPLPLMVQQIIGKKLTFALSNALKVNIP